MYFIYKLEWDGHPEVYVGCSKDPASRLSQHTGSHAAPKVRGAVERLGRPTMAIIDESADIESAREKEMWHIQNLCATVEWLGGLNTVVREERRAYADVTIRPVQEEAPVRPPVTVVDAQDERARLNRRKALAEELMASAFASGRPFLPMPAVEAAALARRRQLAEQLLSARFGRVQ